MKLDLISLASFILVPGLALGAPLGTRENDSLLTPATLRAIEALLVQTNVPGMSIVLTTPDKDEILNFGNATIFGEPVTDDTFWGIASNSKLVTSVLLAMLSEDQITLANGDTWQLDTPLIDLIPNFKMVDENATRHATTLDFLSHSSGLPTHNYAINANITNKDWVHLLADLPPTTPFRSLFQYSNVNYAVAGSVVEYLTGRDFYELATERVLKPAGLTLGSVGDATYDLSEAIASGLFANGFANMGINATQCAIDTEVAALANETEVISGPSPASCYGHLEAFESWTKSAKGQEYGGGGGVNLNGRGLLKWARAMTHAEGIPQRIIDIVDTPRFPSGDGSQYNMGSYTVTTAQNQTLKYHGGSVFSHLSLFGRAVDSGIGVFIVSNSVAHSSATNQAVWGLVLNELLAGGETQPEPEPEEENGDDETAQAPGPATPQYPPLPTDPRPSPTPLEEWSNITYTHPAYGQFHLSILNMSDSAALEKVGLPPQAVAIDLASSAPSGMYSGDVLYAYYGHLLAEHLILTHFDGPLYNFTVLTTYPSLDVQPGEDTLTGHLLGQGAALLEAGKIGLYTWVLGDQSLAPVVPEEGNVDAAEIVFSAA